MKVKINLQSVGLHAGVIGMLIALGACSEKPATSTPVPAQVASAQPQAPSKVPVSADSIFATSTETVDSITAIQTSGVCSLENIVTIADNASRPGDKPNSYKVNKDESYRLVGFATNQDLGIVPADIEILLSGLKSYSIRLKTGGERGDVAKFFNNDNFANAGFMHDADFSNVDPGEYAVYVLEHDGGKKAACSTNQSITVM